MPFLKFDKKSIDIQVSFLSTTGFQMSEFLKYKTKTYVVVNKGFGFEQYRQTPYFYPSWIRVSLRKHLETTGIFFLLLI